MSFKVVDYLKTKLLSPRQIQVSKHTRQAGRNILRAVARSPKIHEPLSIQRTNTTLKPVLVSYKTRVVKINGRALTLRKPAEKLYSHYAARQVAAVS